MLPLRLAVRSTYILSCGDCNKTLHLCSLCCVCVWRSKRVEACVAAIAGTYASTDMAGESARSPARRGAGVRCDSSEGAAGYSRTKTRVLRVSFVPSYCGTRSQPCSTLYTSMAGQAKVSMPGLIRRGCSGRSRLWQLVLQIVTVFPVCDGDRECARDTLQFPRA